MTASNFHLAENRDRGVADVQSVVPGAETALMLQRLANFQPRVPARNPNTVRGSRERKPVEHFPLTHDPLTGEAL